MRLKGFKRLKRVPEHSAQSAGTRADWIWFSTGRDGVRIGTADKRMA